MNLGVSLDSDRLLLCSYYMAYKLYIYLVAKQVHNVIAIVCSVLKSSHVTITNTKFSNAKSNVDYVEPLNFAHAQTA